MFGLLGFPGAARVGEANTRIAMRKTAILAVRKYFDIVASFGAGEKPKGLTLAEIRRKRGLHYLSTEVVGAAVRDLVDLCRDPIGVLLLACPHPRQQVVDLRVARGIRPLECGVERREL
jgi:hypothetical protein